MATSTPSLAYRRRTPEQSVLHEVVRSEWPALRALCKESNDGRGLPVFIEKAVDKYLKCGDLRHGFVRAVCGSCHESMVVGFSCKARGICNSCDGRRMTEVAAHWVDEVIPAVPVRQFVLTFPWDLRYLLAWNAQRLCAAAPHESPAAGGTLHQHGWRTVAKT